MRLLLTEQPYETALAGGQFRYERSGQPTGAIEYWRLSCTPEQDVIARIDLDGRASSGDSYLYHWLHDAAGAPLNLRFRFFNAAWNISGQVLFEPNSLTLSRTVNGRKWIETQEWSAAVPFLLPCTLGLKWAWEKVGDSAECLTLNTLQRDHARHFFALQTVHLVTQPLDAAGYTRLEWEDQVRELWFRPDNWLAQMRRQDGLTAVATQLHIQSQL